MFRSASSSRIDFAHPRVEHAPALSARTRVPCGPWLPSLSCEVLSTSMRALQMVLGHECEDEDKKESLIYQLQVMFANLQESEKMAYNPKGFCHALKVRWGAL